MARSQSKQKSWTSAATNGSHGKSSRLGESFYYNLLLGVSNKNGPILNLRNVCKGATLWLIWNKSKQESETASLTWKLVASRESLISATQLKVNESTMIQRKGYKLHHLIPDQYDRRHPSIDMFNWAKPPFTRTHYPLVHASAHPSAH